jgi:predicted trehalose synthase
MLFDLSFPFVVSSMLVRQGKPNVCPILGPLERFDVDAAREVALVASLSL